MINRWYARSYKNAVVYIEGAWKSLRKIVITAIMQRSMIQCTRNLRKQAFHYTTKSTRVVSQESNYLESKIVTGSSEVEIFRIEFYRAL